MLLIAYNVFMSDPRQKERHEDDPVEQVVESLNNAIDDLELADSELEKDLEEINKTSSQSTPASGNPADQPGDYNTSSQSVPSSQQVSNNDPAKNQGANNQQGVAENNSDQNSSSTQTKSSETKVYENSNDTTSDS